MSQLRAAVIGAGHIGRFHAQKYATLPGVRLVAVVDCDLARARRVAEETGSEAFSDLTEVIDRIDVASVAVPTSQHYAVGRALLEAGVHVLMEKPIAASVDEARALIELARERRTVLQIGHLERFNPGIQLLRERATMPQFIEAHRLAPFKSRAMDVNVVLDLMIHDIDLVLMLVDAPVERVDASGLAVLSDHIDIANARIQFSNGCVANLTASRVSFKTERRIRLFQADSYLAADTGNNTLDWYRREPGQSVHGLPDIAGDRIALPRSDPLRDEIRAFLDSAGNGRPPQVGGEDGLRALELTLEVVRQTLARPLPGGQEQPLKRAES